MKRIACLALILVGCSGDGDTASRTGEATDRGADALPKAVVDTRLKGTALDDVDFAADLTVDLESMSLQKSGLYVQVLRAGEGPKAAPGDRMGVHYTVWISDGTKLDSSFDHSPPQPYDLVLGDTPLIGGWNEGVNGMRLGERRRLVVPYQLAYGAEGRPGVPGYSTLVFEVELATHTPAGE